MYFRIMCPGCLLLSGGPGLEGLADKVGRRYSVGSYGVDEVVQGWRACELVVRVMKDAMGDWEGNEEA